MKFNTRKLLIACLVLATSFISLSSFAQLGIIIEPDHKTYLNFEHIFVRVTIRNYAGHTIAFGQAPELNGKLTFEIESSDGSLAMLKSKITPLITGTVLAAGATKQLIIPVTRYYNLHKVGHYRMKAIIEHPQLKGAYESKSVTFNVSSGTKIWEKTVGIPDILSKGKGKIETRNYKIVTSYDGMNSVFYLVVDTETKVYGVIRLGFEINNSIKPICEIDALSNIHILLQSSAKIYTYFSFDINGKKIKKEVFKKTSFSRPSLIRDPETGAVIVTGGQKAIKDREYLEESDSPFNN